MPSADHPGVPQSLVVDAVWLSGEAWKMKELPQSLNQRHSKRNKGQNGRIVL